MRLQLAINVPDLDEAVAFYSKLFGTAVNKRAPGYANFALTEPPLKLVLFESENADRLNHLGVELATSEAVDAAAEHLVQTGLSDAPAGEQTCCYARQHKVITRAPDGTMWEYYKVLEDVKGTTACC